VGLDGVAARVSASHWYRPIALGLTLAVLGLLAFELTIVARQMQPASLGVDFHQYLVHTDRWLGGGSLYLDRQLHGPYEIVAGDSLYPPTILYLTLPFVAGVPELLWWMVPLLIIVGAMVRHRPAPWTWPVMAAMLATPRSIEIVLYGNPVLWATAALAGGTVSAWPSVFVALIKPSLGPLALWGVRHRSWWLALAVAALASLPFGATWMVWLQVVRDSGGSVVYSLPDLLFVMLPVVAWAGRTRILRLP
jgi:hypothetical protein